MLFLASHISELFRMFFKKKIHADWKSICFINSCLTGHNPTLLTKTHDEVDFTASQKYTKTWIISADEALKNNAVYIFQVTSLVADCKTTQLWLSHDGTSHWKNQTFCNDNKLHSLFFSFKRQLWVNFTIMSNPKKEQRIKFRYILQKLGMLLIKSTPSLLIPFVTGCSDQQSKLKS